MQYVDALSSFLTGKDSNDLVINGFAISIENDLDNKTNIYDNGYRLIDQNIPAYTKVTERYLPAAYKLVAYDPAVQMINVNNPLFVLDFSLTNE